MVFVRVRDEKLLSKLVRTWDNPIRGALKKNTLFSIDPDYLPHANHPTLRL